MTDFYCPACGSTSPIETVLILSPGNMPKPIQCPACDTVFEVLIEYTACDQPDQSVEAMEVTG